MRSHLRSWLIYMAMKRVPEVVLTTAISPKTCHGSLTHLAVVSKESNLGSLIYFVVSVSLRTHGHLDACVM